MTTGNEQLTLPNAFAVTAGPAAISQLSPSQAGQGETLNVAITGVNTHFAQGQTAAFFGQGITVNGLVVSDATLAVANITVNQLAAVGYRSVTVTTGGETASIATAFLVVLDAMTPAERVSFILHDVFRYPFPEVAEIVGRTPAACRQLASSARRRISAAQTPAPPTARRAELIRQFKEAWEATDIATLVNLLDPDVTAVADGGGVVIAALEPVHGGANVAQYFSGLPILDYGRTLVERTVNGQPGLVVEFEGVTETVIAFDIAADRITNIWAVRNPEKLRPWTS